MYLKNNNGIIMHLFVFCFYSIIMQKSEIFQNMAPKRRMCKKNNEIKFILGKNTIACFKQYEMNLIRTN